MKRIIFGITAFILFTLLVKLCPAITLWDKELIMFIQNALKDFPLWLPELPDCKLYSVMIAIPLIFGSFYFIKKKEYMSMLFLCSIPLVAFVLNCIIKPLIHRARPLYELQLSVHPHSFSYVSSHSLVTFCLWGMVVYFLYKYCSNSTLKFFGTVVSVLWILFVGFSRIWLGVHNPSDVLGAYVLGWILLIVYVYLFKKFKAVQR